MLIKLFGAIKKFTWVTIFYLSIFLVVFRLICGGNGSETSSWLKITFCILLYFLFLLEGLLVVGTQLKSSDDEAITSWLSTGVAPNKTAKSLQVYKIFRDTFESFVAGRQILVMAIIVGMTICVEHLHIEHYPPAWVDVFLNHWKPLTLLIWPVHFIFQTPVLSVIASFILITLVPCWLSQLLPQFLADGRSFEFINVFPLTGTAVRMSMAVANIGAGLPGNHAFNLVQNTLKKFTSTEAFGISDRSLFEKLASSIGYHISARKVVITLGSNGYRVADTSEFTYVSGQHDELVHSIRTPNKGVSVEGIRVEVPAGLTCGKPVPRALKNRVTQDSPSTAGEVLYENQIFSSAMNFPTPIPITQGKEDQLTLTADYAVTYPKLLGSHEFILDIPKLTKSITVIIEREAEGTEEVVICKPEIQFFTVNGSLLPDRDKSLRPDAVSVEAQPGNVGYTIKRQFLPFSSLLEIKIECIEKFIN